MQMTCFTITTSIEEKERLKKELPPQLNKFNLWVNESKQKAIRSPQKEMKNGKNASYFEVFLTLNMTSKERDNQWIERENLEITENKS